MEIIPPPDPSVIRLPEGCCEQTRGLVVRSVARSAALHACLCKAPHNRILCCLKIAFSAFVSCHRCLPPSPSLSLSLSPSFPPLLTNAHTNTRTRPTSLLLSPPTHQIRSLYTFPYRLFPGIVTGQSPLITIIFGATWHSRKSCNVVSVESQPGKKCVEKKFGSDFLQLLMLHKLFTEKEGWLNK